MRDPEVRTILRRSQPPLRRFWPAVAFGVLSAGSAVALLGVSAWLDHARVRTAVVDLHLGRASSG